MKFFTPKRLLELQNRTTQTDFLAALDAWERAAKRYQDRLNRIQSKLPPGLRGLIDSESLHDSRVLDMWWDGRSEFAVTLHPDVDSSRLIVLRYSLVAPPDERQVLPASLCSEPVVWLYDELDKQAASPTPRFSHNILLSDGREITLQFRQATVKRPLPVVPLAAGILGKAVRDSA